MVEMSPVDKVYSKMVFSYAYVTIMQSLCTVHIMYACMHALLQ